MASVPRAVYLRVEPSRDVVAVVTRDALRLPNAVVIPRDAAERLATAPAGATAHLGASRLRVGGLVVTAAGWWEPVPRLPTVRPLSLRRRAAAAFRRRGGAASQRSPEGVPGDARAALETAAGRLDGAAGEDAAAVLLGLGPGLTPAGDDLLAGTIAASRLLGKAVGNHDAVAFAQTLGAAVRNHGDRTTSLSLALLECACRGAVAQPVASLLGALAGRGDPAAALGQLARVGHTSGDALATGVLFGCHAALAQGATVGGNIPRVR